MVRKSVTGIAKPASKSVREVVAKPRATTPAPSATPESTATARTKPPKEKYIEGRFSFPRSDHALLAELKATSKRNGRVAKKNELLRAGLRALAGMPGPALVSALDALDPAKRKAGQGK